MRLKVIGACLAAMVTCMPVAQAQTVTIGEVIQVMGDVSALELICQNLNSDRQIAYAYMKVNGVTEKVAGSVYLIDIELAKKESLNARKAMTVSDNCAEALRLYGDNGTVIKGMFELKTAGAN